jgi:Uma2 family endonuclease
MLAILDPALKEKETLADLLKRLGDIPPERILLRPPPGTAKEKDVVATRNGPRRQICELVEGVLVEKAMGTKEAFLAGVLLHYLWSFLDENDLGIALPGDGMLRILPRLVRIPDVSFISWDRLPEGQLPDRPIAKLVPDLAVEILSKGNTPKEMTRKIQEYFKAGVRLVWVIDEKKQHAEVYWSLENKKRIAKSQPLEGGDVLPGFRLVLGDLFANAKRRSRKR